MEGSTEDGVKTEAIQKGSRKIPAPRVYLSTMPLVLGPPSEFPNRWVTHVPLQASPA